ncbi:MAG: hypothetical protein FJ144_21330 [Deltaproteobacteria bacterium]|nr:hypothetical protein [Deltaproteobacteria bacterium]
MTCREFVDFIADYLEGELAEGERASFAAHLDHCAECRSYLAGYEATVSLARGAFRDPTAPVPEDVPEALVEAIRKARRPGSD